jgi:hypothetical protein
MPFGLLVTAMPRRPRRRLVGRSTEIGTPRNSACMQATRVAVASGASCWGTMVKFRRVPAVEHCTPLGVAPAQQSVDQQFTSSALTMRPSPTMPRVARHMSTPRCGCHSPRRMARSWREIPCAKSIINPIAWSATPPSVVPGMVATRTPCSVVGRRQRCRTRLRSAPLDGGRGSRRTPRRCTALGRRSLPQPLRGFRSLPPLGWLAVPIRSVFQPGLAQSRRNLAQLLFRPGQLTATVAMRPHLPSRHGLGGLGRCATMVICNAPG